MDKIYKYEYIAGQKGKNKLFADGTTYWKCEQYKKKCKSRVIDKLGDLCVKQTHNHESNSQNFEVTKMMNTIKQQAKASKILRVCYFPERPLASAKDPVCHVRRSVI
jgi:hypothetical protein